MISDHGYCFSKAMWDMITTNEKYIATDAQI